MAPRPLADEDPATTLELIVELRPPTLRAGPRRRCGHDCLAPPTAPPADGLAGHGLSHPASWRPDQGRAFETTTLVVHPLRGGSAERMLAGRLHPLAPRRQHRRGDPRLDRRPLPQGDLGHRPPRVTGQMVVTTFTNALDAHGVPASTLTDNGMVFTTRLSGGRGGRNRFEH